MCRYLQHVVAEAAILLRVHKHGWIRLGRENGVQRLALVRPIEDLMLADCIAAEHWLTDDRHNCLKECH